ncbi:MAG: hypothetical protein HOI17_06165 [Alphaproteobacteria bacterium]|nr:hypothetical protein [Alphaproteobacteria bacterium]
MTDELQKITKPYAVTGRSYIVKKDGEPYASEDSMSHGFISWCRAAGLHNRSAHGIRKFVGEVLASSGASQYEIMAVHSHNQSQTSDIYTKGTNRRNLASKSANILDKIDW